MVRCLTFSGRSCSVVLLGPRREESLSKWDWTTVLFLDPSLRSKRRALHSRIRRTGSPEIEFAAEQGYYGCSLRQGCAENR